MKTQRYWKEWLRKQLFRLRNLRENTMRYVSTTHPSFYFSDCVDDYWHCLMVAITGSLRGEPEVPKIQPNL